MAIGVDGRIGVLNAGSSLTLAAYLASIGKNSSWGLWEAGTGMAANSDGTGTVSNGGECRKWSKSQGSGLSAEFIQPTSGQGLLYGTSVQGAAALYGESDTNSRGMYLDSNTPVSSNYTCVIRANCIQESTATQYGFSHGTSGTVNAISITTAGVVTVRASGFVSSSSNQTPFHIQNFSTSSTTSEVIVGFNGSSSNTTCMIGKRSTGSSPSGMGFRKILIVSGSQLTRVEMDTVAGILGA